jgi:large subunit ribosomal protein L7/L12
MLTEIGANKVSGHQGGARADRPGPEGSQGLVDGARRPVKEAIAKADAEAAKKKLEDAGAKAELK